MKRSFAARDALRVARRARQDRLVHGRHRRVPGRLRLVEPLEEAERVEARRAEHAAAGRERGEHRRDQAVDVEQRHDVEAAVVGREPQRRADVGGRGREVGVAQRHQLRPRGRAGGVEEEGDVARPAARPAVAGVADRRRPRA